MKWLMRGGFTLVVLILVAFVALATWEPFFAHQGKSPDSEREYKAEIIRSEYGVPHIYGETDADVAFGVAIAQSEDDFFTLQDVIAMSRGRYGAIAGQDGAKGQVNTVSAGSCALVDAVFPVLLVDVTPAPLRNVAPVTQVPLCAALPPLRCYRLNRPVPVRTPSVLPRVADRFPAHDRCT